MIGWFRRQKEQARLRQEKERADLADAIDKANTIATCEVYTKVVEKESPLGRLECVTEFKMRGVLYQTDFFTWSSDPVNEVRQAALAWCSNAVKEGFSCDGRYYLPREILKMDVSEVKITRIPPPK